MAKNFMILKDLSFDKFINYNND
jgi:hypothetical protein